MKSLKHMRFIIALLVMVGTFATLVGGNFIYQRYYVQQPLTEVLKENPAVRQLQVEQVGDQVIVTVELSNVNNLQETYQHLEKMTRDHVGSKNWQLKIIDSRTPNLEKAWEVSQFALYEAAVQGNFTHMASVVEQVAQTAGLDRYGLYVDAGNVYLQMHQGQNYMYAVVPRSEASDGQMASSKVAGRQGGKADE